MHITNRAKSHYRSPKELLLTISSHLNSSGLTLSRICLTAYMTDDYAIWVKPDQLDGIRSEAWLLPNYVNKTLNSINPIYINKGKISIEQIMFRCDYPIIGVKYSKTQTRLERYDPHKHAFHSETSKAISEADKEFKEWRIL